MPWIVAFHDDFETEFLAFEQTVQDALLAAAKLLADYGLQLGRPYADTLKGSKHANVKELRFDAADGAWRAPPGYLQSQAPAVRQDRPCHWFARGFAFDPERKAILLVVGDKSGGSEKRFYRQLIAKADRDFPLICKC